MKSLLNFGLVQIQKLSLFQNIFINNRQQFCSIFPAISHFIGNCTAKFVLSSSMALDGFHLLLEHAIEFLLFTLREFSHCLYLFQFFLLWGLRNDHAFSSFTKLPFGNGLFQLLSFHVFRLLILFSLNVEQGFIRLHLFIEISQK